MDGGKKWVWARCLAPAFPEEVHHLIRLHFAKRDDTLYEALNRLEGLKKKSESYRD